MRYALGSHRPQEHLPLSFTERHLKWKLRILSFNAGNHWAIVVQYCAMSPSLPARFLKDPYIATFSSYC